MTLAVPTEVPEFTERREGERVAISLEVALTSDSQFFAGITGDIARGGVFVCTYRVLPIGTLVDLTFSLPDGAVIATTGKVRWHRPESPGIPPGLGVSFEALDPQQRTQIDAFCKDRAPLYWEET